MNRSSPSTLERASLPGAKPRPTRNAASRPRRRRTDYEPNPGYRAVLAIGASVALVDWAAKAAVIATVPVGGIVEIWTGRVALWHVRNHAMILGLWDNLPLASRQTLAALSGMLAVLLFLEIVTRGHRLAPERRWSVWLFAGMAFGGMLGNLGERALHWWVTDYLSFGMGGTWSPPGNVADLALFLSIPLAVPVIVFELAARARRGTGRPRHVPPRLDTPSPNAAR